MYFCFQHFLISSVCEWLSNQQILNELISDFHLGWDAVTKQKSCLKDFKKM